MLQIYRHCTVKESKKGNTKKFVFPFCFVLYCLQISIDKSVYEV